jgi:hypothetical protein
MNRRLFDGFRRGYFPWFFLADLVIWSLIIGGVCWVMYT